MITCIINFMLTDVVMKSSHSKILIPFALIYGPINYLETKKSGKPLYSFLTWEDNTSVMIYIGLVLFTLAAYHLLAKITNFFKRSDKQKIK